MKTMTGREEELLAQVEALIAQTQRDAERVQRQDAEREAERAEAARTGRLGPDWQDVQRRIDAGQTTLAEVFGGTDDSPAAVRLRARSRATIEILAVEQPPALAEEAAAARAELEQLEERP
jgi:hypothetical protein